MEPTPAANQPLVEYVRTRRSAAGYALAVLAVLLLAGTAYLAVRGFRADPAAAKAADKAGPENPLDPDLPELPRPSAGAAGRNPSQFHVGWIGGLFAALAAGAAAGWLLAGAPPPDEARGRSEARVLILAVGGLLGAVLVVLGAVYLYLWSESLTAWLGRGEAKEARWVLIPLLMTVLGAALVFLSVQPARAEERNNPALRRVVYGSNFALTVLLLGVALVAANVVAALRVPNELDTTETGFYALSDETRDLLRRLGTPVTAYAVVPDASVRQIGDVKQFLLACQDASGGKFTVRTVSPVADKKELARLTGLYPQLDLTLNDRRLGGLGAVVLATGPDEKRHAVIPVPEFFSSEGRATVFVGEGRVFRELTQLADPVKPVVYFTQGSGELSVDPDPQVPDDQKADRLRRYLEKNYLDVRPLALTGESPAVPADAAVVVVAGPRTPFPEPAARALRAYATTPRGDGKKGKLVVLAGAVGGPGGKGMMKTGLEGVLADLNVQVGDKFVYTLTPDLSVSLAPLAGFTKSALAARQPIAVAVSKAVSTVPMPLAREVLPGSASPGVQASPLLLSVHPSWLEDGRVDPGRIEAVVSELLKNEQVQKAKQFQGGRPLAVVVSEGGAARAAVFGSAEFVSDAEAREYPPETAPYTFDLLGVTVDWLRERPAVAAVGIKSKQYQEYKFPDPAGVDTTRLLYLPLGLGLLAVVGLGAGVWVVRRA